MPSKKITMSQPLPGMSAKDWDLARTTKTAAQLAAMGCVSERTVECCKGDGTGCGEHDPDAVSVRTLRAKALRTALSAAELATYQNAEIRAKAKGLIS